jgi:hypothetical protein
VGPAVYGILEGEAPQHRLAERLRDALGPGGVVYEALPLGRCAGLARPAGRALRRGAIFAEEQSEQVRERR